MNQEHPEKSAGQQGIDSGVPAAQNRRRKLIQAGLAGAPVLMALKSTPALAANCKLPSGFSVSGNLSHPENYVCAPNPPGPAIWVNTIPDADKVLPFQSASTFTKSPLDSGVTTLLSALTSGQALDRLIVAAWLNAKYGHVPDLTTAMVTAMWDQGVQGAGYIPIAGATPWHAAEVQAYLQYLMP